MNRPVKFAPIAAAVGSWIAIVAVGPARAQSGYQTIQGTRVFTVVDEARGVATFSNECGSQTLTHGQLEAGAIPDQIIPCPRTKPGLSNGRDNDGASSAAGRRFDQQMCIEEKQRFDKLVNDIYHKPWSDMQDAAEFLNRAIDNHLRAWCPRGGMANVVGAAQQEIARLISQVEKDRQYLAKSCDESKRDFVNALNSYTANRSANGLPKSSAPVTALDSKLSYLQLKCSTAEMNDVVRWAEGETAKVKREIRLAICRNELALSEQAGQRYSGSSAAERADRARLEIRDLDITRPECADFPDEVTALDEALAKARKKLADALADEEHSGQKTAPPPPPASDQLLLQCNRLIDGGQKYYGNGSSADPAAALKSWTNAELACDHYPDRMAVVNDMKRYWATQIEAKKRESCRVAVEQAQQVFGKDQTASPDQGVRAWTADRITACQDMREFTDTIRGMQDFWNDKLKTFNRIRTAPNPFGPKDGNKSNPFGPNKDADAKSCMRADFSHAACPNGVAVEALNTCDKPVQVRMCLYGLDGQADCRPWFTLSGGTSWQWERCSGGQRAYDYDAKF